MICNRTNTQAFIGLCICFLLKKDKEFFEYIENIGYDYFIECSRKEVTYVNNLQVIIWFFPILFMFHDFEEIIFMRAWISKNKSYYVIGFLYYQKSYYLILIRLQHLLLL